MRTKGAFHFFLSKPGSWGPDHIQDLVALFRIRIRMRFFTRYGVKMQLASGKCSLYVLINAPPQSIFSK